MTTKVGQSEETAARPRAWHAALWRAWMLLRTTGRALGLAAKVSYLALAFIVIAALGIGVLTITIGGLIADAMQGTGLAPEGASRSAVASVATITLCLGSLAAVGVNRLASSSRRPFAAVRLAAAGQLDTWKAFWEEWSSAGTAWSQRVGRRTRRPKTQPPARTGDGHIVGHRIWLVGPGREGGATLIAPISRRQWERSAITAGCDIRLARRLTGTRYEDHDTPAPSLDCVCGVYAMKRSMWPTPRHRAPLASGAVALTGRVIEATRGYRAEQAEVVGPVRIDLVCAGEIETDLWTTQADGSWRPVPPNPCPFSPVTLAAGVDEYVGLCRIHAARLAHILESVSQMDPLALQAQLELRYGVDVIIKGRAAQWT